MINVNDFKTGITIKMDNNIYQVVEFQHVKPGKGAAFVRTKLKNLRTGATIEHTFNSAIKVETARIERQDMQFLYAMGDTYYFMNMEDYSQIELNKSSLGDDAKFLKENDIRTHALKKISEGSDEIPNSLRQGHIAYFINTKDLDAGSGRDGAQLRQIATEYNVTMFTSLDTVDALLEVLEETTLTISTIDA